MQTQNAGLLESEGLIPEAITAQEFGNTVRTLRRWHELGFGPSRVKLGKKIYYKRSAISEWIAGQEKKGRRTR